MNTETGGGMQGGEATVVLPGGYLDDVGTRHREAVVHPLSGHEEELLTGAHDAPAALITRVLSRCVDRVGSVAMTPVVARRLLVADRLVLLLRLRALTFGPTVQGTLHCPWSGCAATVAVDFSVDNVPVTPCETLQPTYALTLSPEATGTEGGETLAFRLPRGDDVEAAAPRLAHNAAAAFTELLQRCLLPEEESVVDLVARLSPRARVEIETAMEAHAPAVHLDMDVQCPECGRAFTAPFDVQDFFLGELRQSRDLLYRQVHYLAYHYHWSEREILDLPREKRQQYIEILADEIEAINTQHESGSPAW